MEYGLFALTVLCQGRVEVLPTEVAVLPLDTRRVHLRLRYSNLSKGLTCQRAISKTICHWSGCSIV